MFCRVRPAAPGAPAEPQAVSFPADGDLAGRAIQLAAPPINGRAAEEYSFAFDRVFGPTAGQVRPCARALHPAPNPACLGPCKFRVQWATPYEDVKSWPWGTLAVARVIPSGRDFEGRGVAASSRGPVPAILQG